MTAPTLPEIASSLARLLGEAVARADRLRPLPTWALWGILGLGLLSLVAGARRRRPLALAAGACLGAAAGLAAAGHLGLRGELAAGLGAAALGGAALAWPWLFPLAAGAIPGALLGAGAAPGIPAWQGALLGAVLLGGLGLIGSRLVAALAAGLLGATLAGAALLGLAGRDPRLAFLAASPALLAGLLAVLAVAGAALQVRTAWGRAGSRRPPAPAPAPGAEPQHA